MKQVCKAGEGSQLQLTAIQPPTDGAGNFCSGIGTAEWQQLITGELWFKVPEAIKIVLNGHLRDGVMSKDVILRI